MPSGDRQQGNALVVWNQFEAGTNRVQARRRSAAGVPGPVLTVSTPGRDASPAAVAEDGKGNALIVWPGFDGHNTRIQSRTLSATGALGPIVFLSAPGADAFYPAIAMNPLGRAFIVWSRDDQIQGRARSGSGALSAVQNFSAAGAAAFPQAAITAGGDARRGVVAACRFQRSH
jgi:hypothetical protein